MKPSGSLPVGVADLAATDVGPGVDRFAARLFYPCQRSWTLPCTWIPHINYARGYIGYVFKMVAKKDWKTELARSALISAAWALGGSRVLPVYYNAPVATPAAAPGPLPVLIFSHGLAGTRNAYSSICIEMASRGYLVMALEHSDGSASCARLPRRPTAAAAAAATSPASADCDVRPILSTSDGQEVGSKGRSSVADAVSNVGLPAAASAPAPAPSGGGSNWYFYCGLGDKPEQLRKTRHRVAEVAAAYLLLAQLNGGLLSGGGGGGSSGGGGRTAAIRELPAAVANSLRGRLDLERAAVAGHSYGGATAAAAAASLPYFKAAVSLDPWWDCFDDSWPVLNRWVNPTRPPLLVIGSDDWNTPNAKGMLKCGGVNQERVLAAAAAGGGGAVLVVPRGSTHTNFDDVMLLFGKSLSALLRLLNIRTSLEPRLAHRINMWCITHFLSKHLPPPPPSSPSSLSQQLSQPNNEDSKGEDAAGHRTGAAAAAEAEAAGSSSIPSPSPSPAAVAEATGAAARTTAAQHIQEGDIDSYRETVGEWLSILRVAPGRL
ncbi:hypothetical protein Vretimale_14412 [Volvox reticuliferus]|uniref:1-alkyl-2-acetylglycerophosphocholine esterase n=1 Tax=Volvox reticuliferus TaxID=1737510 RepID=A0A8J4LUW6_9CHLO|nr:hypothetical protein Vretimale_14412 [Volvox reticuliferus]